MPLRIRCPHCQYVLIARDEDAGEPRPCPGCGREFTVPLPRAAAEVTAAPVVHFPHCPRCGTELPFNMPHCYKCFTDLVTGRRLPWKQRLRLMPGRTRLFFGVVGLTIALAVFTGVQLIVTWRRPPKPLPPATARPVPAVRLAGDLLQAEGGDARRKALAALSGVEQACAPAVAEALRKTLSGTPDDARLQNCAAAIELLARHGAAHATATPEWLVTLERCEPHAAVRDIALIARARLGDQAVLPAVADLWLIRLERFLLLARVVELGQLTAEPGIRAALARAEAQLAQAGRGLRVLARAEDGATIATPASAYWASWGWLGQGPGNALAEAVFDLAKPTRPSLEFQPEAVRGARDALKRAAESGPAAGRAAAGMILHLGAPQYRTAAGQIAEAVVHALPECSPVDQQRVTWAASRLGGRLFGPTPREHPLDVTADEVAAAWAWAAPGSAALKSERFPAPPVLAYRVSSPERQLEHELLRKLRAGGEEARQALATWRRAELGVTPRIRELLHPGQRQPDARVLAGAFVIVAEQCDTSVRRELELWRDAREQPAWLRALAYTVLGSFDARSGQWTSGWPAGLDVGDVRAIEAGPGWHVFGRVLSAGGRNMIDRLTNSAATALPPAAKAMLLEAAREN
jgi:hypothetical protein